MRILRHYVHQAHIKVFGHALQFWVHARNLMMQQAARTPHKPPLVAKREKNDKKSTAVYSGDPVFSETSLSPTA